jgi:hypothetical protein
MGGGTFWIKFRVSAGVGLIAFMAAKDAGLPAWRNHPIGDATDFAVAAAWTVAWFLAFMERR